MSRAKESKQESFGDETESVSDRRIAVSLVLHEDDEESGYYAHDLPRSRGTAQAQKVVKQVENNVGDDGDDDSQTRIGIGIPLVEDIEPIQPDSHQVDAKQTEGNLEEAPASEAENRKPPIPSRDHEKVFSERSLSGKIDIKLQPQSSSLRDAAPTAFRREERVRNSLTSSAPGAFSVPSGGDPILRHQSQASVVSRWTSVGSNRPQDVLVDAELVDSSRNLLSASIEASTIEAASAVQVEEESLTKTLWRNRRLQLFLCLFAVLLVTVSVVVTIFLVRPAESSILLTAAPSQSPSSMPSLRITRIVEDSIFPKLPSSAFAEFENPSSPQSMALEWAKSDSQTTMYPEDRVVQRYALATLYYATNGSGWNSSTGWVTDLNECLWHTSGSSCNETGHFTSLRLDWNNLKGTLPVDILLLSTLTNLALEYNSIGSSIPPEIFAGLTNLETFSVRSNEFAGDIPTEIGLLTAATSIRLQENFFSGTLPSEIGLLSSLHGLYVHSNFLEGTIPTEIGTMTSLVQFWASNTILHGTLPTEIGRLSNLVRLTLRDTYQTNGTLPTEFGNLKSLKRLELQRNALEGTIPTELGKLDQMTYFNIGNNSCTGTIPEEIFVGATNLSFFSMYGNSITGTIPTEIGLLTAGEEIYLDSNFLWGTLPSEIGVMTRLQHFWAYDNLLEGTIPPEVCALPVEVFRLDCFTLDCSCQ